MDRQIKIYLDKIIKLIKNDYPLFKNLKLYGFYDQLSNDEMDYVLSGIFEQPVRLFINVHYYVYDENNSRIYYETSRGKWVRKEYDKNGRKISYFSCRKKIRI